MQIRDFMPEDKQAYIEMSKDFYSGPACLHEVSCENFQATFEESLRCNPYMRGLMITENGERIGYALLAFYWSCEAGGFTVQAEELYFTPENRGKGYGHRYFEWLFAEYPQAKRFRLEVCPENPKAKQLYSQLGFEMLNYGQMIREK